VIRVIVAKARRFFVGYELICIKKDVFFYIHFISIVDEIVPSFFFNKSSLALFFSQIYGFYFAKGGN
jgi:hypothetical protein